MHRDVLSTQKAKHRPFSQKHRLGFIYMSLARSLARRSEICPMSQMRKMGSVDNVVWILSLHIARSIVSDGIYVDGVVFFLSERPFGAPYAFLTFQ